jgi:hypothetical protein
MELKEIIQRKLSYPLSSVILIVTFCKYSNHNSQGTEFIQSNDFIQISSFYIVLSLSVGLCIYFHSKYIDLCIFKTL